MKICIVSSNFYPKVTTMLIDGAKKKLIKNKFTEFDLVNVQGTFEIPVVVANLIESYDGFIVLGCVIKGETPHFDFLCTSVFNSISNLSVTSKKPIGNGILTCINKNQAYERANLKKKDKGGDAANAVISILKNIKNEK